MAAVRSYAEPEVAPKILPNGLAVPWVARAVSRAPCQSIRLILCGAWRTPVVPSPLGREEKLDLLTLLGPPFPVCLSFCPPSLPFILGGGGRGCFPVLKK